MFVTDANLTICCAWRQGRPKALGREVNVVASAVPAQVTDQGPSVALIRAPPLLCPQFALSLELLGDLGPILLAFLRFFIELGGTRCRPSSASQPAHDHYEQVSAAPDGKSVTDGYRPAWLRPRPVDLHLTAGDGLCCKRARLEKSCRPQPLVQADSCRVV